MHGIAPLEQLLKRLGQRFPGQYLAHPDRVAAMGWNDLRRQQRAGRRPLQEAEIRMPVATEHTALLIRLLEDPDDLGLALERLHIGQPHRRTESARDDLELIERETLLAEEQHLMAGKRLLERSR